VLVRTTGIRIVLILELALRLAHAPDKAAFTRYRRYQTRAGAAAPSRTGGGRCALEGYD
jgi:hypothetical protein